MKIRNFLYMIKQGCIGLWRNRIMSIISIGSIASALMILGIVLMVILNINNLTETVKGQFDSIQLYLKEDLNEEQMDNIKKEIEEIEGVKEVSFLSKKQALEDMKKQWGEQGYLLNGLEKNPLPNSYIIKLKNVEGAGQVVSKAGKLQGVEEVKYYKDILDKLLNITKFVRLTGVIIISILTIISMFVVVNTIKLTVIARRREISIMKYVGATNWFIRWPFLVEGMFLGLLGSLIALGVVGFGYKRVLDLINQKLYVMISSQLIPTSAAIETLWVIFIVLGIGIGALASIFSMRKFLKV